MKNWWKSVSQPQSAERAERSEAREAWQFVYASRLRNASRRSERFPDAQNCLNYLNLPKLVQTDLVHGCQVFKTRTRFPFPCQDRFLKTAIPLQRSSLFGSLGASPYRPPFSMVLDPQMDLKMDRKWSPKWYHFSWKFIENLIEFFIIFLKTFHNFCNQVVYFFINF